MASRCGGRYEVIRLKDGKAQDYSGKIVVVEDARGKFNAKAVPYNVRPARDRSRSPVRYYQRDQDDSSASSDDDEESSGDDYVGDPAPFKGVYSRLSLTGRYAPRANLAALVTAGTANKIKQKHVKIAAGKPNRGQNAVMGQSATVASKRNLPATTISDGHGGGQTAHSEEWCHLQAACLGGDTIQNNLVAASYACNTYMMAIETYLKTRTEFSVSVTAYCLVAGSNVAEAIRYKVFARSKGMLREVFNELIDATAQHFSREDLEALKRRLKEDVP
jgi:hypothetical protein